MGEILPVLMLVVGLAVGGGAVWLLLRAKIQHVYDRGKSEGEGQRIALTERLEARQRTIDDLDARARQLESQVQEHRLAEASLRERAVKLETTLQQERKQTEEKLAVLGEAQQKLSDAFKALAADALKTNNQSFLELAKATLEKFQESAKGDLDKRQQAIGELVKPVKESLEKVDEKIRELEKTREGAYQGLREQVSSLLDSQKELHTETANLVKALRRPEVRGRWGEIQLRRTVELAGMLDHCDFFEQQSIETDEGRLRPDLLVQVPGNLHIVVDSKAPLDALLDAMEAPDEQTRAEKLADHVRQVRAHISALGKKAYPEQKEYAPALDLVVLFLPGEVFFRAAVEGDPKLIEFALKAKVILASPTTLISLLRAVACGWRQEALAENAKEISDLGKELHKRLADMSKHIIQLGKSLDSAFHAYNRFLASLQSRVLVSARKFQELGATGSGEEIGQVSQVETSPRMLQSPELLSPREEEGAG
jgi:DNA recombination protein RmuC